MFRSQRLLLFAFLIAVFSFSCRAAQRSSTPSQTFVGKVYLIGNMPFAKLALKIGQEQTYVLDCPKEVENTLVQHQGQTVKILARPGERTPEGNSLKVISAEILQE
jgi:hypothetical protein